MASVVLFVAGAPCNADERSFLSDMPTFAIQSGLPATFSTTGNVDPTRSPNVPESEFVCVDEPSRYASAEDFSLFRRPLPSTNLKFVSTVMWDGRETDFDTRRFSGEST